MSDMELPEEDDIGGIPEWVVTFGDMMSLLLCFFIMLVSMSEIKEDDKFFAVRDAIQKNLGYDTSNTSAAPGKYVPRPEEHKEDATTSNAKRDEIKNGNNTPTAPKGDNPRVTIIRNGHQTAVGAVIQFKEGSAELVLAHFSGLEELARGMRGKQQKIEVRGHTTYKPLPSDSLYKTHKQLAFFRCENIVQHLVTKTLDPISKDGMDENRFRISVAAQHEKLTLKHGVLDQQKNARVEIFLLNEVVPVDVNSQN
ncbi:MAG: flagellar motor protein MotB [Planctomycetes bacterium]|nr:flagellar motor protein MotB [Planctomycetota bacterium]